MKFLYSFIIFSLLLKVVLQEINLSLEYLDFIETIFPITHWLIRFLFKIVGVLPKYLSKTH